MAYDVDPTSFDPEDAKPEADAAEQQRPALRDDLDADQRALQDELDEDTTEPAPPTDTAESDPADLADQQRVVRLPEEEEPWPG
ncbi:hypothetical protein [Gandjariella thermophila]|nr:hypothetical protein [Gandjariella thermophila]